MPTYAQLQAESWWGREIIPQPLKDLGARLCGHFNRPAAAAGTKGDNVHLSGSHRSQEWIKRSRWCTNRSYTVQSGLTTTQARYIAGFDFNPGSEQRMIEICSRLDRAVRAGTLEQVREWYGNDDGDNRVDGYNNVANRIATSDASHLWHLHLTFDRRLVNSAASVKAVGDVLLGAGAGSTGSTTVPVPSGSPMLRTGSTGTAVRQLQAALNEATDAGLKVDGDFGPATESALQVFQRSAGLDDDGIYGPATAGALRAALEDDMTPKEMLAARVDMFDEAGKKRWWAGTVIGKDGIPVNSALFYGAMVPFYLRDEFLPLLKAIKKQGEATLAATEGLDTAAIIARVDQRAAEDAARDAAMVELMEAHADGSLDAEAVVRKFGELLVAAGQNPV